MRYKFLQRRAHLAAVALTLSCSMLIIWNLWRVPSAYSDQNVEQQFYARVREGVGTEARLPAQGASATEIRMAVDSTANFIYTRAGVSLSEIAKARLATMEASARAGTTGRITSDDLSHIVAGIAIERIRTLTDQQIAYSTEILRGFNAPDLPQSFREGRANVRLRASEEGTLTPLEFTEQLTAIREASRPATNIYRASAQSKAAEILQGRLKYMAAAIPEQYASPELTPLQALILTYSVAADDLLTDNAANLQSDMEATRAGISDYLQTPYPSPAGKRAYGVNGYVFSTPLDLVFDEQTVNRLLDRIAERSAR